MASWKGSSKRKGWWEENVENEDKSAKRPKNLDEENCSNSSNSEPPEIEIDEKSWNKIMSDNDESLVSEPWAGGMFSNQVGTSLRGGYNLPPALNEIGLMYSPRNSDSFEQEEPKNTPKSRDSNEVQDVQKGSERFLKTGCVIQMSQCTPSKFSMLFKHTYS